MLELKDIKKQYKIGEIKQEVLKGISINFRDKEFASILGASGSGKTTLLNIIGGLDKYDSGDLLIEGVSTKKYNSNNWDSYRNHKIGFVFQNYNLIMHQSVLANVELSLTLSGMNKKTRRKMAIEALEKVGLKDHINKLPSQLSGGQMQRVAIARALVNDPEIILADEPTGALDSNTSIQIMDILKEISKEKLVIMVTHNPQLANDYSTRIIELKDGLIIKDSDPFNDIKEYNKKDTVSKTSMSFMTSIGLSFKNLLTKKGRTALIAIAGSIGIIGIALILALSNGVKKYASDMESTSMSDYPIELSKDVSASLFDLTSTQTDKTKGEDGKVTSDDDVISSLKKQSDNSNKKNNLKEFKNFLNNNDEIKNCSSEIRYDYDIDLQVYSLKNGNYVKVNPNEFDASSSTNANSTNSQISSMSQLKSNSLFEQLSNSNEYIEKNYDLLAGKLPQNYNEVVLVVDKNNLLSDSTLYALNIKDRNELTTIVNKIHNNEQVNTDKNEYSYNDFLNLSYKLILNTDYYKKENDEYKDYSNDKNYMKNVISNGIDLKVVGVLRPKEDSVTSNVICYKSTLMEYVINNISNTSISKEQLENTNTNILTGDSFDGITNKYEDALKNLGIASLDDPNTIKIYPKDSNSKSKIIEVINKYNEDNKQKNREDLSITYNDSIKDLVKGVTSIINVISGVLIAFVAISLIVSSIMIAIITYISVLERTKEIGILRAIGATKKDVSRVFNAETILEGFISGILGVGVTLLLSIPTNIIVKNMAHIDSIAKLSIKNAILLIALSIVLNLIAGLIPASMASKKDPVEALRSE